jgi:hypothetical protein
MTSAMFRNLKNDPAGNLPPLSLCRRFRCGSTLNSQFAKFLFFLSFVALFAFQHRTLCLRRHHRQRFRPLRRLRRRAQRSLRNSWKTSSPESRFIPIPCWHRYSRRPHSGTKFPRLRCGRTSTAVSGEMHWQMQSASIICNGTRAYWRCYHSRRS